ncbi:MAG: amidohydrolase family protein [Deltaproteobacteria bacterium]|nr:amidohydrolase family protein [Deltaproteobacteria bacterium]
MPSYDLVIAGGTVIDGLRTPRFTADVAIRDGRIAAIGSVARSDAARVIDARGQIVCPGFVDLHTHYDSQVFWDPYCTISGWHGVTSVVIGNCGFGFAPVKPADRTRSMLTMERNEAVRATTMAAGMPWDWETYPEFLDSLDRTPKGLNLLSYVGLNPLMTYVMGLDAAKSRGATASERAEMARLLGEALDAGGCGFSAQLLGPNSVQRDFDGTPMITDTMSHDDLVFFAGVLREKGRGFIQVIGADAKLTERLCEASGRPVVWNALVLAADQHGITYGQYRDVIRWIDDANARGLRVFAQALTCQNNYEFSLDEWNLFDSIPAWRAVTMGTPAERAAKMRDAAHRDALRASFDPKQTLVGATVTAIPDLVVSEVGKRELDEYVGFSVGEIAAKLGAHPVDAMLDLALADDLRTRFATPPQKIDMTAMREVVNSSFALPGVSDGGAHMKFLTLGRYPTEFLSLLVRDNGLMDLEQAHWRLSAYPALAAGIRDRGFLREGAPADVLVYDLERLRILPTGRLHDFPAGDWRIACKADGYRFVIVNGEITFEDGVCTGATPGKLLRHGRSG